MDVEVLPLVRDTEGVHRAGWCSYASGITDGPEVEIICGGINSKSPDAAALWRQGYMLHFGFEQSPAEMNEAGRSLLVNSIAYIAKFKRDRPILRVPFVVRVLSRRHTLGYLENEAPIAMAVFKNAIAKHLLRRVPEDRGEYRAWFEAEQPYLHPGADGALTVDTEAKALQLRFDDFSFFIGAIAALERGGDDAERARTLLTRYVFDGPMRDSAVETWKSWVGENKPYLFFSEIGGFRWYVDQLARSRAVPTAELRGTARADPAASQPASNRS